MSNANAARDFAFQIDQEWAAKDQDIDDLVHEIALQALRGVVQMSPVDTGRFRGNWVTSVDTPSAEVTQAVKSPAEVIMEGDTVLGGRDELRQVYIQNNLPYANRLENGWSKQAPTGMVGVTLARIQATYEGKEV